VLAAVADYEADIAVASAGDMVAAGNVAVADAVEVGRRAGLV